MKDYSILIFNNKTGELQVDIECNDCVFNVHNEPQFCRSAESPNIMFHTHTVIDRKIKFKHGEILLPDITPRNKNLDRQY